jgi:hypothetical protein
MPLTLTIQTHEFTSFTHGEPTALSGAIALNIAV